MIVRRPVDKSFQISSPFGSRIDPITQKPGVFHKGVDFAVPVGTPVKACFDGVVAIIGAKDEGNESQRAAGNRIALYGKGYRGLYFHLQDNAFAVKLGQFVKAGDVLAHSGNTGRSTGPHLHFQLEDMKSLEPLLPEFEDEQNATAVA